MTNSKEESIDGNIIVLFVSFTLTFYYMHTFYTILAIKTCGIVLKENFDIFCITNSLLHYLRSSEIVLPDNKINLLTKTREIQSIFTGSITTTNYSSNLLTIEETITGSTGTDSHTIIFLFVRKSEILCLCSCCNNDAVSLYDSIVISSSLIWFRREVDTYDFSITNISTKAFCLLTNLHHHLVGINTLRISREILHDGSLCQLSSHLWTNIFYW